MTEHVDVDTLQDLKEVMEDEFDVLISTYLDDSVDRLDSIRKAVDSLDVEAIRKEAHSLKGSSDNLGAPKLADLCRQLEDMGKEGVVDGADSLVSQIASEYDEVKSIMEGFV